MSKHPDFQQFRPHPWHGLTVGDNAPEVVNAYIEMTPFDSVKYEIDKETGYLRVDRPQRFSSQPPTLYGFVPRTYCADRVGELSLTTDEGDLDPLDICVLSERPITRAELLVSCRVIGGLHMVDHGEADDKIVAVLENDTVWAGARDISDVPEVLIERLRHYFLTYKMVPGETTSNVQVDTIYGADHAQKLVRAAMADYQEHFGK
ncbi:inorganic pyrophosphatase [Bradymonadaceae bacterium TMQ3]|uniref:inorganic diphosphatase n=1 Tax=Lujinxingia sediminis TaxID=2480984 RepID=A0ABY0CY69_9DELT|nr:inorganic pyrophosphatase [Lujinxingia sediminis]RDV39127.1 inorganic pyrophosphatase [Bradymonadaceae bacterium TMQ3]RVU48828.1 inorganic pyrophosphatase [Lujinxingia sediminis]TXC78121.1 inorganic pyrophosphatase [Bradymonadales bacterium TMQ1]